MLLVLCFAIDSHYYAKEGVLPVDPTPDTQRIGFDGMVNFAPEFGPEKAQEMKQYAEQLLRNQA